MQSINTVEAAAPAARDPQRRAPRDAISARWSRVRAIRPLTPSAICLAVVAIAGVLVAASSAYASPGGERFLPSARGQSAAANAVLHLGDFPARSGWVDLGLSIADPHLDACGRRLDDLVVTGYALSSFVHDASPVSESLVISSADVFTSRVMLSRYVARTLSGVQAIPCLRLRLERNATGGTKYVSLRGVRLPGLAPTQRAFRISLYPPGSKELWEEDAVFLARGRTLAIISVASPVSAHDRSAKLGYFRRIAARIAA